MELPKPSTARRVAALTLSVSSLAVALTACGQGNGTASGGVSCSTTAPGVTKTEIKAGLLWGDTGSGASSMRAFRAGVDARIGLQNDRGGVDGRKITYAWRDDASDQNINLLGAQQLVDEEKVFGIIEAPGATTGSVSWLGERKIPVTGLASDPGWVGLANMFSFYYLGNGSSTVYGDVIRAQGGTRAALITTGSKSELDFSRQYSASLAAAHVPIVKEFPVSETTGYQNLAQQLKQNNIDTLAGVLLPDAAVNILPAARALGVQLKVVIMPLGYDPKLLQTEGPALAGTLISTETRPWQLNTPEQKTFLDAMNQYSPEIQPPNQDSGADGYVSADLFIRGLEAAGACPTRESFVSGLRAVRDYDGAGLVPGNIDLSQNYQQPKPCYYFVQVSKDGKQFVPMFDGQPQCGNPISAQQMDQLLS
ncbi:ABC transporter substrate-binding protein [Frankia sp. AgB1.9]|uniref:ABC transporter substrate-binding protein n=1 Tax=unclassified Frankia TaxID=2632575 RepID=UPI001933E87B|nr:MULTISPECIES: ABC transporter substrate-binding protein [unclassified Frankia]MBL7490552.1 ABC transporter substrate-binding protein [Frankia sp. AgW1.1]MBL7553470.1 ABC transporter substrate-binding protein [Frankia sp. AgB1.9]MBL7622331.1 ABC transporter substrate-binding protein [Frankia sp. AgB1.8]